MESPDPDRYPDFDTDIDFDFVDDFDFDPDRCHVLWYPMWYEKGRGEED